MSDKSNKFGYVGVDIPAQSFGNNKGVFNPAEINELVADNKWTQYGQLELIQTQTASNVAEINFTDIKEDIYNVHLLTANNITITGTDNVRPSIRFYESGVVETAAVYEDALERGIANGSFTDTRSTGRDHIYWMKNMTNNTNGNGNGYCYIYNAGDNTKFTFTTMHTSIYYRLNELAFDFGSGVLPQASIVDGIRIFAYTSDTFATGTFSLYGIKEY